MNTIRLILNLMIVALLLVSCGDSSESDSRCLYDFINIRNKCDQDIIVRYNDEVLDFDPIEFIFNYEACDVVERNEVIEPDGIISIRVFLGRCSLLEDATYFESCNTYFSRESISVQYGENVKDFLINRTTYFSIEPNDFR